MATILVVTIFYIVGAIVIGIPMGKKSLAVWKAAENIYQRQKTNGGLWGFFLFPMTSCEGEVGISYPLPMGLQCWSDLNRKDDAYLAMTAMLWVPRIILNLIVIAVAAGMVTLGGILLFFFEMLPSFIGRFIKTIEK